MGKGKYIGAAVGCYINYFVYGMAYIMVATNMSFLTEQFHTDKAGISFLLSAYGFGRLFTLYFDGILSDKFGRKPFILLGCIFIAAFLIGIPLSPSYQWALVFAVCGGMANAFFDAGTYPLLMEIFPKSASSANVMLKAFISFGSFLLPLMITLFMSMNLFYGWSFFIPGIIFLANGLFIWKSRYPEHVPPVKQTKEDKKNIVLGEEFVSPPKFSLEGVALLLIGFTAPALLYVMQTWLPTYAQEVIGMPLDSSLHLLSYYAMGSVISVIVIAFLMKKIVKPVTVLYMFPAISLIATIALLLVKLPTVAAVTSFIIGASYAGVLQIGLTVLCKFFTSRKGTLTGIMYTFTGIAQTAIPLVTGLIMRYSNIKGVFILAIAVNFVGLGLGLFVAYRHKKVFEFSKQEKLIA